MRCARSLTVAVLVLAVGACHRTLPSATVPAPVSRSGPEVFLGPDPEARARPAVSSPPTSPKRSPPSARASATPRPTRPEPRRAAVAAPQVTVSRTVPPLRPTLPWSNVVVRLEFINREKSLRHLGTGFVIRDQAKKLYLMTCAHLIEKQEWRDQYRVLLRTMNGQGTAESLGTSLFVGTSVDLKRRWPNGWPDMTQDLVIRSVADHWARPLPLAPADPEPGEWVWAVGCEALKSPSDEKLFAGRIVEVVNGCYILKKYDRFDPHGFSGGPIVNQQGQVVGNVIAGGHDIIGGATVRTLRQRLAQQRIRVD